VVSEEGERTELRDEDDDLLRAAEELGIDLAGVRGPAGDGADGESLDDEEVEGSGDGEEPEKEAAAEDLVDGGGSGATETTAGDPLDELALDGDEELDLGDIELSEDELSEEQS
jgi:DNA-directed RNA polymerase subunit beta